MSEEEKQELLKQLEEKIGEALASGILVSTIVQLTERLGRERSEAKQESLRAPFWAPWYSGKK